MILNHRYQFIFLKTSKTAGTSIEIALSKFCSPGDIVTPVSEIDEDLRAQVGGLPSRVYPAAWWEYGPIDWYKYLKDRKQKKRFYNHVPARKAQRFLPDDIWNSYFKFCVARNPWDRAISQYFWRYRHLCEAQRPSLDEFLSSSHARSLLRKGHQLYTIGGRVQVDRIMRFENLDEDLESVRAHLGLPERLILPKAKAGHRKDRRHYRDLLTPHQRDRIARMFRCEIELLGYEY